MASLVSVAKEDSVKQQGSPHARMLLTRIMLKVLVVDITTSSWAITSTCRMGSVIALRTMSFGRTTSFQVARGILWCRSELGWWPELGGDEMPSRL